jgi:hypothetical protein
VPRATTAGADRTKLLVISNKGHNMGLLVVVHIQDTSSSTAEKKRLHGAAEQFW